MIIEDYIESRTSTKAALLLLNTFVSWVGRRARACCAC